MFKKNKSRNYNRLKRHKRIRNHIYGTSIRPRLNVFKSSKHIYAQIIDDTKGFTIASFSTVHKDYDKSQNVSPIESARIVGRKIAELAKQKKVNKVVFDRSGYIYHGRVKELANAARDAGLDF